MALNYFLWKLLYNPIVKHQNAFMTRVWVDMNWLDNKQIGLYWYSIYSW